MRINAAFIIALLFVFFTWEATAQSGNALRAATGGGTNKILVEEHFTENDRGWNQGTDNNIERRVANGYLELECKKYLSGGGGYWIKLPDFKLPATDYSVSVTTTWVKNMKTDDSYSPYGIILGNYYILLYGDGDRRLLKYDTTAKKYETIVDWGVQSTINKKGSNKMEIEYKEGKLALYVNGYMMYRKEATIPAGTPVKLYIENSEMVRFDDLIVKQL